MTIDIAPRIEQIIREQVEQGKYPDAAAVVSEAVLLLEERTKLARLRAAVTMGYEALERGAVIAWTPDFMERLKERAARSAAEGRPIHDDVTP